MAEMSEASWLKCQLMDVVVSTPIHLADQPTARLNLYAVRDGKPGERQLMVVGEHVKSLIANIGNEASIAACCKAVADLTGVESAATRAVIYGKRGVPLIDASVIYSTNGQAILFRSTVKTVEDLLEDRNELMYAATQPEGFQLDNVLARMFHERLGIGVDSFSGSL